VGVCDDRRVTSATLDGDPDADVSRLVHHLPAAVLAALAVGLLVAVPEAYGDAGRLATVAGLQAALVLAWSVATARGELLGSVVFGLLAAAAADLFLVVPDRPTIGGLLAVLGLGVPAAVLRQMFRRPREALVASLAGSALLLASLCAFAVLLRELGGAEGARLSASSLLAVGAAVVAAHVVDLVLPRPQIAYGVPRGLLGLVVAVLAAAAITWLRRRPEDLFDTLGAAIYGGIVGAVAVLVSLAASYIVVQADRSARAPRRPGRWALPVIQALLPVAACAPLALALAYQTTL
jgi:hypothetical protein